MKKDLSLSTVVVSQADIPWKDEDIEIQKQTCEKGEKTYVASLIFNGERVEVSGIGKRDAKQNLANKLAELHKNSKLSIHAKSINSDNSKNLSDHHAVHRLRKQKSSCKCLCASDVECHCISCFKKHSAEFDISGTNRGAKASAKLAAAFADANNIPWDQLVALYELPSGHWTASSMFLGKVVSSTDEDRCVSSQDLSHLLIAKFKKYLMRCGGCLKTNAEIDNEECNIKNKKKRKSCDNEVADEEKEQQKLAPQTIVSQWTQSSFTNESRKQKFLSLMGVNNAAKSQKMIDSDAVVVAPSKGGVLCREQRKFAKTENDNSQFNQKSPIKEEAKPIVVQNSLPVSMRSYFVPAKTVSSSFIAQMIIPHDAISKKAYCVVRPEDIADFSQKSASFNDAQKQTTLDSFEKINENLQASFETARKKQTTAMMAGLGFNEHAHEQFSRNSEICKGNKKVFDD